MLPDLETPDEDLLDEVDEGEFDDLDDFADLDDEVDEFDDGEEPAAEPPVEPRSRAELDDESLRIRGFFDGEYRAAVSAPTGFDRGGVFHRYWTTNPKGLAKWADKPRPWTALYHHILKHVKNPEFAKRIAADWFHDVFHFWPGSDMNRVTHGKPPRGHMIGPG